MRQQIDAYAQWFQAAHAFKDVALNTALLQHQPQGQAPYACADDNDFQVHSPILLCIITIWPGLIPIRTYPYFGSISRCRPLKQAVCVKLSALQTSGKAVRSEEHPSELQSLMRIS